MRNFDERKAEVFRRSENRIKERKRNRNRILSLGIPLFLCVAVLFVIYLPNMMITSDKSNSAEDMNMAGGADGTSGFVYTSLEITNNRESSDNNRKESDIANIENIYYIIQSAFNVEEDALTEDVHDEPPQTQKGESADKDKIQSGTNQSETTTQNSSSGLLYTIIFNSNNSKQTIYTLDGNLLANEFTKQEVTLTDSQLLKLQKALGLELTWEEESN